MVSRWYKQIFRALETIFDIIIPCGLDKKKIHVVSDKVQGHKNSYIAQIYIQDVNFERLKNKIISQMKVLLIKKNAIDIEVKGQGHYVIFIAVQRSEILCILCLVNSFKIS